MLLEQIYVKFYEISKIWPQVSVGKTTQTLNEKWERVLAELDTMAQNPINKTVVRAEDNTSNKRSDFFSSPAYLKKKKKKNRKRCYIRWQS